MHLSAEEALSLLGKWREEEYSVLVNARFESPESHFFWGSVTQISHSELTLAGDFVGSMRIPLDSAEFDFADVREAPEPTRSAYANFESVLSIRFGHLSTLLMLSSSGIRVPILPPDIIAP
jgi:hypothetical protein